MGFVYFFSKAMFNTLESKDKKEQKPGFFSKIILLLLDKLEYFDLIFFVFYHVCEICIPPPARYPWFYPLINASYAFAHFVLYYLIANVKVYLLFRK